MKRSRSEWDVHVALTGSVHPQDRDELQTWLACIQYYKDQNVDQTLPLYSSLHALFRSKNDRVWNRAYEREYCSLVEAMEIPFDDRDKEDTKLIWGRASSMLEWESLESSVGNTSNESTSASDDYCYSSESCEVLDSAYIVLSPTTESE
jgi:hypothetical protein